MKYRTGAVIIISTLFCSACDHKKEQNTTREFIKKVLSSQHIEKKETSKEKKIITLKKTIVKNKDPFHPSQHIVTGNDREKYLRQIFPDGLRLSGIIQHDGKKWAVLKTNHDQVIKAMEGQKMIGGNVIIHKIKEHQVSIIVITESQRHTIILSLNDPEEKK